MTPIADTVTEVRESVPEYEAGSYQKSLRQQGDAPQETSLQQGGAALPERPSRGAAVWRGSCRQWLAQNFPTAHGGYVHVII
ncbi:hypothetical protein KP509_28G010400 [Ceratopteris richardii]|uniref:Uncharacterized protein n=1 Tax=Ceratopteris richardii TaxID=49495 RepID=A0A8T2RBB1_CERRI|nr:hypothetical protein KP509_28G010400 [Ceratopteris richardii]